MSKEAMKLALEALENAEYGDYDKKELNEAITALQEALVNEALNKKAENARELGLDYEPAQQEPVAWMQEMPTQEGETRSVRMTTLKEHATLQWGNPIPLYTTPPAQRTWVGLTDEEVDQGLLRSDYAFKTAEAWRAGVVFAMTKLKEKNT